MRIMICALASGLSLSACQPGPKPDGDASPRQSSAATTQAVIRGRATYLERVKMPPGADLVVELVDLQRADSPQAVIANLRLDDVAGPPYEFTLPYDRRRAALPGTKRKRAASHSVASAMSLDGSSKSTREGRRHCAPPWTTASA